MSATTTVGKATVQRIMGEQPSVPRASFAAAAVGGAVAVVVYRALRS